MFAACEGAAPIAEGALQAAELRETYARACAQGSCTLQLQTEFDEATKFLEDATEEALAQLFEKLDANSDGKVSFSEALIAWRVASEQEPGAEGGVPQLDPTTVALLQAMRQAKESKQQLDKLKYSATLLVDGAIAAVDQDGDGQISIEEAVQAPARVASWLTLWKDLLDRGKL